jgi:starch synthase
MSERLNEKILMSGIELSDVETVAGNANYETLSKLAMEYSDGVIQASEKVNANLLEDIKKSQKLFLPYVSEENYVTSYNEFYDKVLEK